MSLPTAGKPIECRKVREGGYMLIVVSTALQGPGMAPLATIRHPSHHSQSHLQPILGTAPLYFDTDGWFVREAEIILA
jgi:hypothetical protein